MPPVDLGHPVEDPGGDELPGAEAALLGGLPDAADGAGSGMLCEAKGGAQEDGRVPVVAAGVHVAGPLRGELQARLLLHREGIGVCAQRHGGPRLLAGQVADHPVRPEQAALEPDSIEGIEDRSGGLLLISGQLRVAVQRPAQGHHALQQRL